MVVGAGCDGGGTRGMVVGPGGQYHPHTARRGESFLIQVGMCWAALADEYLEDGLDRKSVV